MKITPLDIQKKTFRSTFRGFDPAEVDGFLDMVASELEEVVKETIALREDLRRKNGQLEEYRDREKVLQDTLVTAQKITTDIKDQAQREAELMIAGAEQKANKMVQDAHRRLVDIIQEINELKRQKAQFEAGMRQVIQSHLALMDTMREHPAEPKGLDRARDAAEEAVRKAEEDLARRRKEASAVSDGNVAFLAPRVAVGDDE